MRDWTPISCAESDELRPALTVISSCTDMVACTREDCDWSRGRLLSRLAADRHGLDHYQRAHGGRR